MDAERLIALLKASPTGRQLLVGEFVVSYSTTDPADTVLTPPDGTVQMWNDSGTLRLRGYSRATGWQTL